MNFKALFFVFNVLIYDQHIELAQAEIIIHATRLVYPSDAREVTLQVSNNGSRPSLVQLWIDAGDLKSNPDNTHAPFVIIPPLSRVNSNRSQSFRIMSLPVSTQLNQNQESLYWLNVLEIPAKPDTDKDDLVLNNYLQIAIRSRIKVFYRPKSIVKQAVNVGDKLQWFRVGGQLRIKNTTPFFITIKSIYNKKIKTPEVNMLPNGLMLDPFSQQTLNLNVGKDESLFYITINDYGAYVEKDITFKQ